MPIIYDKLFSLLKEKKLTMYSLRRDKIVGTETLEKMRKGTGHIDTRTIEKLCKYLNCKPGDIMDYAEDIEAYRALNIKANDRVTVNKNDKDEDVRKLLEYIKQKK